MKNQFDPDRESKKILFTIYAGVIFFWGGVAGLLISAFFHSAWLKTFAKVVFPW
jgi:ABC-type antimicrobial peptide transport system permease subunit